MFKITITETKTVKKVVGKKWEIIGTTELLRDECYRTDKNEPKTRIDNVYGYTPEIEKGVEVESTILIQEVETLNLSNVIKAINNL